MKDNGVIFLKDWKILVNSLSPENQLIFWEMFTHYEYGVEQICENQYVFPIWNFVKSQLDNMKDKYNEKIVSRNQLNGSKGGRPKKEAKETHLENEIPENPLGFSETQKSHNNNEKDNEKDNNNNNDVLLKKEPKGMTEIFNFEKVWNSFEGKKNSYEKDYKNFLGKTDGLEVDFEKLFNEAKKSKNIYFQSWINSIYSKSSKKVAQKKVSIPEYDEFWGYTERYIISNNLGPPENWKIPIEAKYNAWKENGWKDGNGKSINNWKTKIQNTIPFLRPIKNGQTTYQSTNTGYNNQQSAASGTISGRQIIAKRISEHFARNSEGGNNTIDIETTIKRESFRS
ncbi:DUF6291 domain-containing protein [Chryseobacterium potabilaquae]|uniref:DUF6291 domain-containing protein n=1 Tax=Chryseobacterium potabilaquae TaxID=2675057 RepID=A0A6N4XAI9_9FLAO|nr:DUF6291 domain-containing protein [Chryseobacterium potabilaquae]CAA7196722.1 hypothetical protein CHRY9293_02797 [Chryseobacterium potabilaquae]